MFAGPEKIAKQELNKEREILRGNFLKKKKMTGKEKFAKG